MLIKMNIVQKYLFFLCFLSLPTIIKLALNCKDEDNNCPIEALVREIEQDCDKNKVCSITNSTCHQGKCICQNATIVSQNKRSCLKISAIGQDCEESMQCLAAGNLTECINNKCTCLKNSHLSTKQECLMDLYIGDYCYSPEQCVPEFSKCIFNECQCPHKYTASKSRKQCLLKANSLGSSCSENIQCTLTLGFGAACKRSLCRCHDLYHYNASTGQCTKDIVLNEKCNNHEECHQPGPEEESRLECILGVCRCKSNYYEENNYCIDSSSIWKPLPFIIVFTVLLVKLCDIS